MKRFDAAVALSVILVALSGFEAVFAATAFLPVRHRLPAELARILSPLLEPGEAAVPAPAGLVVKGAPERIEALREWLQRLDRPSKNLILTVVQSDRLILAELNRGFEVKSRAPPGSVRLRAHRYASESVRDRTTQQRLRVLEGQPAYVVVGQERPVPVIQLYGFPPQALGGIEYRPVTSGFRVTARLVGCDVRVTVSPWSRHLRGDGSRSLQAVATTVVVKPGRWIELAGHDAADSDRPRRFGYRYRTGRDRRRIFLRVEIVDGC